MAIHRSNLTAFPRRDLLWLALLTLPALLVGFANDDWFQRLDLMQSRVPGVAFKLYEFIPGDGNVELLTSGATPWFTHPELRVTFFRPLSSLTLAADFWLFGNSAWPAHLHSLAWYAVVVVLVGRVHRRLLGPAEARWATLLFAVASCHADALTWLAARHVLVGGAFGVGALLIHLAPQQWSWRRGLASGALLGLGFLASEVTLGGVAFVLCYEAWGRTSSVRERSLRVLAPGVVLIGYLAGYAWANYGVAHAGGYVSPFREPVRFASAVALRLPVLLGELSAGVPSLLSNVAEALHLPLSALGLGATLLIGWGLARAHRPPGAPRLGWIWLASVVALLPGCAAIISGRVLIFPLIGSSMALGLLLRNSTEGDSAQRSLLADRVARVAVLGAHLGLASLLRFALTGQYAWVSYQQEQLVTAARFDCAPEARGLLLNGNDPSIGMYLLPAVAIVRAADSKLPGPSPGQFRSLHTLSMAMNPLTIERVGERQFVLKTEGTRRGHIIEELYRDRAQPLRVGQQISIPGITAEVLGVEPAGPTKIRFTTALSLDSPEMCLIRWARKEGAGRLESFRLPRGASVKIPYLPGPMGL